MQQAMSYPRSDKSHSNAVHGSTSYKTVHARDELRRQVRQELYAKQGRYGADMVRSKDISLMTPYCSETADRFGEGTGQINPDSGMYFSRKGQMVDIDKQDIQEGTRTMFVKDETLGERLETVDTGKSMGISFRFGSKSLQKDAFTSEKQKRFDHTASLEAGTMTGVPIYFEEPSAIKMQKEYQIDDATLETIDLAENRR
eukprot:gnl/Carplike_NY0171/14030_a20612_82.p1 GENE.gnl/Carplike_NY0171/14030_a20612_82~~gnl/Carplike_NY0171/14030_a20612_82.p1  ORF type:complete len:213 (+),score=53.18 gnl/Carplike_NY0171/14030_a20612_82:41-640(+)